MIQAHTHTHTHTHTHYYARTALRVGELKDADACACRLRGPRVPCMTTTLSNVTNFPSVVPHPNPTCAPILLERRVTTWLHASARMHALSCSCCRCGSHASASWDANADAVNYFRGVIVCSRLRRASCRDRRGAKAGALRYRTTRLVRRQGLSLSVPPSPALSLTLFLA
jgi:hypothetical protein